MNIKKIRAQAREAATARMLGEQWYTELITFITATTGVLPTEVDRNLLKLARRRKQ